MKTMKSVCALVLLTSTAIFAGGTALAGDSQEVPQRIVRFGDLNLENTDGIQALYARISAAAREVCGRPTSPDLRMIRASRRCARTSLANAIKTIDNDQLTAYHARKTGTSDQQLAGR